MMQVALVAFFPFLMIFSAWSDLLSMTISNKVSLALMAGFVFFAWYTGMSLEAFGWHWAMFAIVLSAGFAFFAFGWTGGGDVKLASATALWFGWEHTATYLIYASFIGAGLTIFILLMRAQLMPVRLVGVEWVERLWKAETGIPYGIALGIAAVMVYPHTSWIDEILGSAFR